MGTHIMMMALMLIVVLSLGAMLWYILSERNDAPDDDDYY